MKRLLAFFAGGFGLGALFGRRSRPASATARLTESPADELRQRLAEARAAEPDQAEPVAQLTAAERRAQVHDRARSAIDELGEG